MEDFFSEITCCHIPAYRMASGRIISSNPEDEIIGQMAKWAKSLNLDFSSLKHFGFDIPVSKEEEEKGFRGYEFWVNIPNHITDVYPYTLVDYKGGIYGRLRVYNPFEDPFRKIPAGWKHLFAYLKENDLLANACETGSCLEECLETDEGSVLDLFLKVKKEF